MQYGFINQGGINYPTGANGTATTGYAIGTRANILRNQLSMGGNAASQEQYLRNRARIARAEANMLRDLAQADKAAKGSVYK